MPVMVEWLDDAQTILLLSGDGNPVTMDEIRAAEPELARLRKSVSHRVGIIRDMRNLRLPPPDPAHPVSVMGISQIGGSIVPESERPAGMAFVYPAEMVAMFNQMLVHLPRMLPNAGNLTVKAFVTVEEAAEFVAAALKNGQ